MEQRRVLLIITGVTIVLATIVGVGLWLFYPRETADSTPVAAQDGGLEWEPLDFIQGDGERPGLRDDTDSGFSGITQDDPDDGEFVVTYGVAEDEPRNGPGDRLVVEQPDGVRGFSGTIDRPGALPADRGAGVAERDDPVRIAGESAGGRTQAAPVDRAPPPRSTGRQATEPASVPQLSDRAYWVQVISSPNRDTVEQARLTMDERQLGTRILTKEIGGTTFYRLRLGPFPLRTEAEKFLGWVTAIDGFADALIFVDYTTAVLAAGAH